MHGEIGYVILHMSVKESVEGSLLLSDFLQVKGKEESPGALRKKKGSLFFKSIKEEEP